MLRQCNILIDLDRKAECEKMLPKLEELAFQSSRSQAIYAEIKMINERIKNGTPRQKPIQRPKVNKATNNHLRENDWFFKLKKEKDLQKKLEAEFEKSLNPLFAYIYRNCYLRCCKKKDKYSFKPKN